MTPAMLTKVLVNLCIFIVVLAGSIWYLYRLPIKQKGFKLLFLTYTSFWIAPMLLRAYTGTLQNMIDFKHTAIVLAAYGLIGIIVRPLADVVSCSLKSRKGFLYLACIIQMALYIPVLVVPNTTTNLIESIGVGFGASCIGTFQLLFREQYPGFKNYATVSLLSIPPLLANFLTAPLQSILMVASHTEGNKITDINVLKYLWLIGLIFTLITIILVFFIKENREQFGTQNADIFEPKKDSLELVLLCIIGSIITFIKFSNSGAVGTLHLQSLGKLSNKNTSGYEGYLSVIFSLAQLIGGVMVGTILIKKMSNISIFWLGVLSWIVYMISATYITHPLGYFFIHALNGFGYGVLYNFVLGSVLSKSFNTPWISPMGVYQSILSIGIASSGIFTQIIKNNLKLNFISAVRIINWTLVAFSLLAGLIYSIYWYFMIYLKQNSSKFMSFRI